MGRDVYRSKANQKYRLQQRRLKELREKEVEEEDRLIKEYIHNGDEPWWASTFPPITSDGESV
jgi:hypothetical protein